MFTILEEKGHAIGLCSPPDCLTNQDSAEILPQILLSSDKSAQGAGLSTNFARYWILGPTQGERLQLAGGSESWS
jgi:hypothetical protein